MLIKSIEIRNFRQLNNIKLNFSTDSNKNVSIISGNNGAGKTTLAEAFTWCLYGEVKSNLSILNKDKEEKLKENYGAEVYVKIELEHNNAKYEIIRKQTFKRKKNGEVSTSSQDISREVVRKLKDGRSVHIRELEIDNEIDKILPKDLAKYFFFDGERINSMSKSIEKGGKNSDFAVAVKNLLGLAPFLEAKDHLKFIQKKYREAYQDDGNQKIIKYREGIRKYEEDIIKFKERIEEIESELEIKSKRRDLITEELLKLKDSAELAKQRREYEEQIEHLEKEKLNYEEDITDLINRDMLSFVSQYYIKEAKKILEKNDYADKDIPNLHSKTINYLLERGYCLCGHKIEKNSEEYNALVLLREKLPPNSIGVSVNNFLRDSSNKIEESNFYEKLIKKYSSIIDIESEILNYEDQIHLINKKLLGAEVQIRVRQLQNEKNNIEGDKKKLTFEKDETLKKIGEYEKIKKNGEKQLEAELVKNKENVKILNYKKYVDAIYDEISLSLDKKEKILREDLEREVDTIFNSIYKGGLHINIDEKYNISTTENINISTGQSGAIILSFIAGIIKLAKNKLEVEKEENYTESYPLVIDAPLSTFDKGVIKNICNLIPNIAEQVIIFIKDTDGDLAKEHMLKKIGKEYRLIKIDEHNTVVEN